MCVEVTHCHVSPIQVLTRLDLAMAMRIHDLKQRLQKPRDVYAQPRRFISTSVASSSNAELPSMVVARRQERDWCAFANKYSLEFLYPDADDVDVQPPDAQQHYRDYTAVKEWIEGFQVRDVRVVCNQDVQVFKDLRSIFSSQKIRPDVTVYWMDIPVLVIGVHSSPYERTLTKLALVLVEQLRWLRNGDRSITEWTGFCFPKSCDKTCVSQVDVIWDEATLKFWFTYSCLEKGVVLDTIKSSLGSQIEKVKDLVVPLTCRFSLPLGEEGLGHFGPNAFQVESKSSIIVCDGEFIYKHIIDEAEDKRMLELYFFGTSQKEYQIPKKIHLYNEERLLGWYVFPFLVPPKSRSEARECLPVLVQDVAKAIQRMHTVLKMAHLDIRLENVCFTRTGKG